MTSLVKSLAAVLLAGTAMAAPAAAKTILFSTGTMPDGTRLQPGTPPIGTVTVRGGVTQVENSDGEVFSFVGDATFDASVPDMSITDGQVTVSGGRDGAAAFNVGGNIATSVNGQNATASFTVDAGAIAGGRVLGGTVTVTSGDATRSFDLGQAFAASSGKVPRPISNPGAAPIQSAALPASITPPGQSVTGDIGIGTPLNLAVFPANSPLASFEALAAARGTPGGFRFPATTTGFFDVNLASVRAGQSLGEFSSNAGASLTARYLSALRVGTAPSSATANAAYQAALFDYFRVDGLPLGTPQATRDLLNTYNAIITAGGTPANFSASAVASALSASQRFLAAGGDLATNPAATNALIAAYNQTYTTLGSGNAATADVTSIEAARTLQAALGANANLSVRAAAALLSTYFGSLGSANTQTGGLTATQLQALLAYYNAASVGLTIDAAQRSQIDTYQSFLAAGGSFGQPPQSLLESARLLSRIVAARRLGQSAVFLEAINASGLDDLLQAVARNGVPAGLTLEERERVEAAMAFFSGGGGGVFETPGQPFANASFTSSLTTGTYVVARARRTESSLLAIAISPAQPVTFNADGVPTAGIVPNGINIVPMEGRSGAGWLVGRFGPSPISTTGHAAAIVRPFTGTLPTSGNATYNLLGHTTPQYADGRLVSAATITGTATVSFAPGLVGISAAATISATDPGGTRSYAFNTATGSGVTATNADLCTTATSCRVALVSQIGGTSGEHIAGSWLVTDTTSISSPILGGAWVFGGALPVSTLPSPSGLTRVERVSGIASGFTTGTYVGAQMNIGGGTGSWGPRQVDFNTAGQSRLANGLYQISTGAVASQSARTSDWLLSRWLTSTLQHERDIVVIRPLGSGLVIPTTGRAEFAAVSNLDIVSATGTNYTATRLDGRIAIAFGSAPLFGIDAVLGLTQTGGAMDTYRFGSAAMFANPSGSMIYTAATNELRTNSAAFLVAGPDCGTGCVGALSFAYGGATGNLFGGTFQVSNGSNVNQVFGSAIFQQVATGTTTTPEGVAGRVGGTVTPPPTSGGATTQIVAGSNETLQLVSSLTASGSSLTSFSVPASGNTSARIRSIGTARNNDGGSVGTTIGWTRWAGGSPTTNVEGQVQTDPAISNQGGSHFIWGTRATNIPTSGRVTYDLLGATAVSTDQGSPFGFINSATLAVEFGSAPRVGFDISLTAANSGYQLSSAGGTSAPSIAINTATMGFESTAPAIQSAVGCTGTACTAQVRGFLAGDGASHAGLTFRFPTNPGRGAPVAEGAVTFVKRP